MWISNTKKGFTLIEVLCSITIFYMIFMTIFTIGLCNFKLKAYNEKLNNYAVFMEELKNNIMYEANYDSILKLKSSGKYYIENDNIKSGVLKKKSLDQICVAKYPLKRPYVKINIEDGKIIKLNIELYTNLKIRNNFMECDLYKGKYKR